MERKDKRLIIHVTVYWDKQASKHAAILVVLWDWQQLRLFFSITNLSSHVKESFPPLVYLNMNGGKKWMADYNGRDCFFS